MMNSLWNMLSNMMESIAIFGAGTMSMGLNYEPKMPKELMK